MPPMEMIQNYSADAVRYWAASAGTGKDAVISEERIQMGSRLVTKLWNVARFSERFIENYTPPAAPPDLTPADRWLLSRLQKLVRRATEALDKYDYAAAKTETESFFWGELADNYLEMCKQRLYDEAHPYREGARYTLHKALLTMVKLFAPILPFVTDEVYQGLFVRGVEGQEISPSIHRTPWPTQEPALEDDEAEKVGEALVEIATAVRRYKSENNLPLGTELNRLQLALAPTGASLAAALQAATVDLLSITRSRAIEIIARAEPGLVFGSTVSGIQISIEG